ncbi:AraC-like ligand binding domain-containing protein [Catalinimonas alkaloidigena]|uniref:AraC-like ligand binding domain-containing protein n=1 Tax=Catalinimonas alkaloidigena TaxID=1075417 RepID=A0A1G8Y5Y4_9BACT|nr:AraC family transcriptional regulator [Catalinimonas alkaloidigena]SDJ98161.1 AraC-like ligand binding domain-containing protein [Catalinimonas alkaloidigena]
MIQKREGFAGQKAIVLPTKIVDACASTPPAHTLHLTDLGYYPRAQYHFRERPVGISQNILIYCVEGKGWLKTPAGSYAVHPNQYLIIPAEMAHAYGADEHQPWSIYWAHFKGTQAGHFTALLQRQQKGLVHDVHFLEERAHLFDSIYTTLEAGYSLDNLIYASVSFSYFLITLSLEEKLTTTRPVEKDAVDRSIEWMQQRLEQALTLQELAAMVHLSPSHYSSVFRKKTGYSPIMYFNHLKMQRACQYLQFTTLRIHEVAGKLGIQDPYYFSRLFAKTMGLSPQEYRRKKQ